MPSTPLRPLLVRIFCWSDIIYYLYPLSATTVLFYTVTSSSKISLEGDGTAFLTAEIALFAFMSLYCISARTSVRNSYRTRPPPISRPCFRALQTFIKAVLISSKLRRFDKDCQSEDKHSCSPELTTDGKG